MIEKWLSDRGPQEPDPLLHMLFLCVLGATEPSRKGGFCFRPCTRAKKYQHHSLAEKAKTGSLGLQLALLETD